MAIHPEKEQDADQPRRALLPARLRLDLRHHHHHRAPRSTGRLATLVMLSCTCTTMMVLLHALLSLAPCLAGGGICYRGYESDYSFDADAARNPSWMRHLPDEANLTSLSIPGTHDTMTYSLGAKLALQCQNWDLATQLRAGLRYLDIRARVQDDELHIFHAREPTGHSYEHVLLTVFSFLDANPSEAVVMRLKREGGPLGRRSKRTFQEAFDHARLAPGAEKHMYAYNDTSLPIPTLGQLRSRILILQDWKNDGDDQDTTYGLRWDGPQMVLEDRWIIPSPAHLDQKWDAVRPALERANADPLDNEHLYLAHISASVGVLPIEAAAGTNSETYPTGMNDKTGRWVDDHLDGGVRTGIVIFDFPGRKAIDGVIKWNQHLVK